MIEIPIFYIILSMALHVLEATVIFTLVIMRVLKMITQEELEELANEISDKQAKELNDGCNK